MVMMAAVRTCQIKLRAGTGSVNIHHITQRHVEPPLQTIISLTECTHRVHAKNMAQGVSNYMTSLKLSRKKKGVEIVRMPGSSVGVTFQCLWYEQV